MRIDHDLRIGAEEQRVAVGRRLGDELHRQVAVRARAVFHHDRLPERIAEPRREEARDVVIGAARRLGNQHADRPRRILRLRRPGERAERKQRR